MHAACSLWPRRLGRTVWTASKVPSTVACRDRKSALTDPAHAVSRSHSAIRSGGVFHRQDLDEPRAFRDAIATPVVDSAHAARVRGDNRMFHFHRLNHHHRRAGGDLITDRHPDRDDSAWQAGNEFARMHAGRQLRTTGIYAFEVESGRPAPKRQRCPVYEGIVFDTAAVDHGDQTSVRGVRAHDEGLPADLDAPISADTLDAQHVLGSSRVQRQGLAVR